MNTNTVEYRGTMPQKALTMDDWIKFYGQIEEEADADSCTVSFYWVTHHDDCYGWWHIADDGGNETHHFVAGNPDSTRYQAFIVAHGL